MNMFQLTDTWKDQIIRGLPEEIVERIISDAISIMIIDELDWCSMKKDELLKTIPGSEESLSLLESLDIIRCDDNILRISEPYQGFGLETNDKQSMREIFYMDKKTWFSELGFMSIYIIDSLLESFFGIEPEWEGHSKALAYRAGLIDQNGSLSEKGRKCSIELFSLISEVFDKNNVDTDEMLWRWSRLA